MPPPSPNPLPNFLALPIDRGHRLGHNRTHGPQAPFLGVQIMFQTFTFQGIRVVLDEQTGAVVSVQDAVSGCAAAFMFTRSAIAHACTQARLAWESTADTFA